MCSQIKIVFVFLALTLLNSCNNSEEFDYPFYASNISNSIYVDILDSEDNSIIDNEIIMNGLTFYRTNGGKISFSVDERDNEKLISAGVPLPMFSTMTFSEDQSEGYGESYLTINVDGQKFNLIGKFYFSDSCPGNDNMYGGNGIHLIEIHTDDPNISITKHFNTPKIIIRI